MKEKTLKRMMGALLLIISFAHVHATRRCVATKSEVDIKAILTTPSMHFAPLDLHKW